MNGSIQSYHCFRHSFSDIKISEKLTYKLEQLTSYIKAPHVFHYIYAPSETIINNWLTVTAKTLYGMWELYGERIEHIRSVKLVMMTTGDWKFDCYSVAATVLRQFNMFTTRFVKLTVLVFFSLNWFYCQTISRVRCSIRGVIHLGEQSKQARLVPRTD